MSQASSKFKFVPNFKSPVVLRPDRAPFFVRQLLMLLKGAEVLARSSALRRFLYIDTNERLVEYPFVCQHVQDLPGKKILDFGCVESLLPMYFAARGAEVVGVDLRSYGFEHTNLRLLQGDLLQLHLEDEQFDVIVAVSAVEHVGLDAYGSTAYEHGDQRMMQEFLRLLKPKGQLIITVPFGVPGKTPEMRVYGPQELKDLLRDFKVENCEFYARCNDGVSWQPCREDVAAERNYLASGVADAVACISARRP